MSGLRAAVDGVAARLDTDRRAWTVAVGRLADPPPDLPGVSAWRLLPAVFRTGRFPAAAFPFGADDLLRGHSGNDPEYRVSFALDSHRHFDCRVLLDGHLVGEALTRSGCLDDGTHHPSHVLLADVESALLDTTTLLLTLSELCGYTGRCEVYVDVRCDMAEPLELRVFDEGEGNLLRPPAGYDTFTPVATVFDAGLGAGDLARHLWDVSREIVVSFGVFDPQLTPAPGETPR